LGTSISGTQQTLDVRNQVYDSDALAWIAETQGVIKTDSLTVSGSVSQSGTWNITNVSGTVSLPTGASTSLNQGKFNGVTSGLSTWKECDGKPRVSSMPYAYDIVEGNVTSHVSWSKIGFNAAITAEQDIAPYLTAPYVYPTGATTMTIVSSNAEDTKTTGTGAWTVTFYYLTTGFVEKNVTIDMAGTTPVQIATDIYRVQNARISSVGTSLTTVGNLTIAAGGVTYGYISAGRTRMRQCLWTVPTGKILYITQITFSCADQAASKYTRFTTLANYDNLSGQVLQRGLFMPFNEIALNNTGYVRELNPPTKLPATVDLRVKAYANSAAVVTCSLRGWTE
jgi:hypothetical protein